MEFIPLEPLEDILLFFIFAKSPDEFIPSIPAYVILLFITWTLSPVEFTPHKFVSLIVLLEIVALSPVIRIPSLVEERMVLLFMVALFPSTLIEPLIDNPETVVLTDELKTCIISLPASPNNSTLPSAMMETERSKIIFTFSYKPSMKVKVSPSSNVYSTPSRVNVVEIPSEVNMSE